MKLWILNIGIVAVGGQQCLYDYISQFQSVSRLPKEDSSTPAGQTSQQDFKRNGLSGEDLWQVEHRWPRSWKLHIWIGHEPGAKFFVTTCFWPPSHALDNILLNYKLALQKSLFTSQKSSWPAQPCSSQWPTSPSLGGWVTLVVMPPVFPLLLQVSSEHRGSYRSLWTLRLFSNVTQAVGKDGIYPGVGWFEKGGNANNDPIRGEVVFASLPQIYYLAY